MKTIRAHTVAALCIILAGCGGVDEPSADKVRVGDSVPAFSITLNDGTRVGSPSSLLGGTSVIILFDTTCPDCQRTLPHVQRAHEELPGVRFIAISRAQGEDIVSAYWAENGYTLPYCAVPDRSVYSLFARSIVPRVYVISPDGVITHTWDDDPCPTFDDLATCAEDA